MYRRCDWLWGELTLGECDFSIGFLFASKSQYDGVYLVFLVGLVYLVCFVHLVYSGSPV